MYVQSASGGSYIADMNTDYSARQLSAPAPPPLPLQKADKWSKMMSQEDHVTLLTEFIEKAEKRVLVIAANQQGQLTPADTFPTSTKAKVHIHICSG